MEGSLPNQPWTIQTLSNVLWAYEFSHNVPNHDELIVLRSDQSQKSSNLHGRHYDLHSGSQ